MRQVGAQRFRAISIGQCWWCDGAPADSREHKFKRSDLIREFGDGPYYGGQTLVRFGGERRSEMTGARSPLLVFPKSLCQRCNDTTSQPFDRAYDSFIEYVFEHEDGIINARQIDFRDVFGETWEERASDLTRYFLKHIGCRIAEYAGTMTDGRALIPQDVIDCLDGGPIPSSLRGDFYVDPVFLRWDDLGRDDPLFTRPLWLEPLFGWLSSDSDIYAWESRWRYGWLTLAWRLDPDNDSDPPVASRIIPLPIIATQAAGFEWGLAYGTFLQGQDCEPPSIEASVVPLESPAIDAFLGGVLDLEAALRNRAPDERRDATSPSASPNAGLELLRARYLVERARNDWACDALDKMGFPAHTSKAHDVWGVADAETQVSVLRSNRDAIEGWGAICVDFASMALLQLGLALDTPLDEQIARQAIVEASHLAGKALMAYALFSDTPDESFPATVEVIRSAPGPSLSSP